MFEPTLMVFCTFPGINVEMSCVNVTEILLRWSGNIFCSSKTIRRFHGKIFSDQKYLGVGVPKKIWRGGMERKTIKTKECPG